MESCKNPLLEMDKLSSNKEKPGIEKNANETMSERVGLIRAVRRGIRVTEKYLKDQKDINLLNIAKTDVTGRNIFHLSVQREELLEFLLKKFEKHPQIKEALYTEDVNGNTAAHLAALHNAKKSIQILGAIDKNVFKYRSKLTGKSVMHCAVESGNEYMVEDILDERPDALFDKDANSRPPLHYAAALKESVIMEYLLGHGANIMETDESGYTAIHVAAAIGSISNVKLLLVDEAELVNIVDKEDQTALHIACENGHSNIVSFLLRNGADPVQRNKWGYTVLESAILNKKQGVVDELLCSDRWKELTSECKGGFKKCFTILLTKMPRSAEILLDRCVQYNDKDPDEEDFCVTYDFSLFQPTATNPPTFEVLSEILENDGEGCLLHNVCQKYLSFKWREKGFKIFFLNFFIYLLFHILFNIYVMLVRGAIAKRITHAQDHENLTSTTNAPSVPSFTYPQPRAHPHETGPIFATVFIVCFTVLNMIRELFQLYSAGWKYFAQISNYFEWILYISVLIFMFPVRDQKTVRQFGFGSIAVFFSWFNLIWFFRRLPDLGTYILTLQQVFKTLLKMLLIIILFCMAFASTFYLMLAEQPRFRNYFLAVLSSFVSMLGDFAYDDLFVELGYHSEFYSFKIISFIVFLLLMGIVVNNVLIGLAVGDTENVMNKAKTERLRQQAKFIIEIEISVMNKIPWPCWSKRHMETILTEFPNHPLTFIEKVKNVMFGDSNLWSDGKESEDNGERLSDERAEEIIKVRLESYHKQIMHELKEFHVDLMEEVQRKRTTDVE